MSPESVTQIVSVLGATTSLLIRILHLEKPDVSIKDKACSLLTAYLLLTSYADFVRTRKFSLSVVGAMEHAVRIKETHRKTFRVFIGLSIFRMVILMHNIVFYFLIFNFTSVCSLNSRVNLTICSAPSIPGTKRG
mgnify:CR=1 FL=1